MIYDEGFEVKISIQSYFAFSKYTAEKKPRWHGNSKGWRRWV